MKSVIHSTDIVPNTDRRFGSATAYYPARLIRADGSEAGLLFTAGEIAVAADRGKANPEDVPESRSRVPVLLAMLAVALAMLWLSW
jgi:hypothetical protein